jgi:hypothetical protein
MEQNGMFHPTEKTGRKLTPHGRQLASKSRTFVCSTFESSHAIMRSKIAGASKRRASLVSWQNFDFSMQKEWE